MGALHHGHLSLVKRSKKTCDITVVSIFVNPKQFNNPKDLEKYPRQIHSDIKLLEEAECDLVFIPESNEVFSNTTPEIKNLSLGNIEFLYEGSFRPGHFSGVIDVLNHLFYLVKPNTVFFGEKDFQQCVVVEKLISCCFSDITMVVCQTEREANGLAMSSRNQRLSNNARQNAGIIYQTLLFIKENANTLSLKEILKNASDLLTKSGILVEYLDIADAKTLEKITDFSHSKNKIILIACYIEGVRLIDNIRF